MKILSSLLVPVFGLWLSAGCGATPVSAVATETSFPVVYTFTKSSDLHGFTIHNVNNDNFTWKFVTTAPVSGTAACCPANRDMNDWLVTPGIAMKAGLNYRVTAIIHGQNTTDRIQVRLFVGSTTQVSSMTTRLAEAINKKIAPTAPQVIGDYFTPGSDGTYYIGLRCTNEEDESPLYVTRIEIEAPVTQEIPAEPTEFTGIPDADGLGRVTLRARAPRLTKFGTELKDLDRLEFYCGERLVGKVTDIVPGGEYSLVDNQASAGNNTYTCVAVNSAGSSLPAKAEVFVGIDLPAIPTGLTIKEQANTGHIMLAWGPVSTDHKGNQINPAKVKYNVTVSFNGLPVKKYENLETTTVEAEVLGNEDCGFACFTVEGVTGTGVGKAAKSETIPVGKPLKGLAESFGGKTLSHPLATEHVSGPGDEIEWKLMGDGEGAFTSQDHDNGFLVARGDARDDVLGCTFLKISLEGLNEPQLSFYAYTQVTQSKPSENVVIINIREPGGVIETLLSKTNAAIDPTPGWHKVNVDLSKYRGKIIELRLLTRVETFANNLFDNFRIGEAVHNDLVVNYIQAPETIIPGESYNVAVTYINEGLEDATSHRIILYGNTEELASRKVDNLASSGWNTIDFPIKSHVFDEDPVTYFAEIIYDKDSNEGNNLSRQHTVTPLVSEMPPVTDLSGSTSGRDVTLSWSKPDLNRGYGQTVTEDFEKASSFATKMKWWTFLDLDGKIVGGLMNAEIPNVPSGKDKASFFVWDNAILGNKSFETASGNKFLACMYNDDDSQVDDWAISPVLSGKKQTVSFKAKSYDGTYPETLEVLYSTGTLDPAGFKSVKILKDLPPQWTVYEAELPEGAKRFALRSNATGGFLLMIDDVCYEQGANYADHVISGYDVYRNREKINSALLTAPGYVDAGAPAEVLSYAVHTIYAGGSSRSSNVCNIDLTPASVEAPEGEAAGFTVSDRVLTVSIPRKISLLISDMSGVIFHAGEVTDGFAISLPRGIFIVALGEKTSSVIIR